MAPLNRGPGDPVTHLLYLHGFRSSPLSTKARRMAAWIERHRPDVTWLCPQLPPSPRTAMEGLMRAIDAWPRDRMAVIGSSLGGVYATVVAERTGCRAVLLNPAIDPARDLAGHLGETTAWHSDERFFFEPGFIGELRALEVGALAHPERSFAVIAKGDEVLSWQEMLARYQSARVKLLEASDHALSDFDLHLPDVVRFLGLDVRG
ncbi:MAG: YqiA/YcfP family alpha/beta fold hydrolase [Caldimonas sp.]